MPINRFSPLTANQNPVAVQKKCQLFLLTEPAWFHLSYFLSISWQLVDEMNSTDSTAEISMKIKINRK